MMAEANYKAYEKMSYASFHELNEQVRALCEAIRKYGGHARVTATLKVEIVGEYQRDNIVFQNQSELSV